MTIEDLIEGTRKIAQRVRTNNAPSGDILALVEHAEKCADELEEIMNQMTEGE